MEKKAAYCFIIVKYGLPRWLSGKESACQAGDAGSIPGSGRSLLDERLTDLAVVPREKPHTGAAAREQPRDSPVIER